MNLAMFSLYGVGPSESEHARGPLVVAAAGVCQKVVVVASEVMSLLGFWFLYFWVEKFSFAILCSPKHFFNVPKRYFNLKCNMFQKY